LPPAPSHQKYDAAASATHSAPVPRKASMNTGLSTVALIEFMAAMPCSDGRRPRAAMTKEENAKKMPATSPLPIAAANVSTKIAWPIMSEPPDYRWPRCAITTVRFA